MSNCQFGANCIKGKCLFLHPLGKKEFRVDNNNIIQCPNGLNNTNEILKECENGDDCNFFKNNNCNFYHSQKQQQQQQQSFSSKKEPCKFGDECQYFKENKCRFYHPTTKKEYHPSRTIPCRFGNNCKNYDFETEKGTCRFLHDPNVKKEFKTKLCNKGDECEHYIKGNCKFLHSKQDTTIY